MATQLPRKIGKYDLVGLIGRGASGAVFDAVDPDLNRRVAIKMIAQTYRDDGEDWRRFSAYAESIGSLQHTNIVEVYEAGLHEGYPYLVMEYVEGESLDSALKRSRNFGLLEKIGVAVQICNGLAYGHRQGLAHHDIKPANIILTRSGGVKITDFGFSNAVNHADLRNAEVNYIAPEHTGDELLDFRADLFSTGAVLYQLLSNHLPFEGDTPEATIHKILHEPPATPSTFGITYPTEIESILDRAMAKGPEDRYQRAEDFASDLQRLLSKLNQGSDVSKIHKSPSLEQATQSPLTAPVNPRDWNQNTGGLLSDVERKIQKFESSKAIFALWAQAEKALAEERFEEAHEHAEKALAMDPEDLDLQRLWLSIPVEAARTDKLKTMLRAALEAQADGDMDAARKAAEAALEVAPHNVEAKALHQLISLQALEAARQRQIGSSLEAARQEISSRNFGRAIEILRRAEELDPNAPGVRSLIQFALSGQEQEIRRQQIERLSDDIQEALKRDDYQAAIVRAEESLTKFPQERIFLTLKTQAERYLFPADKAATFDRQLTSEEEPLRAVQDQQASGPDGPPSQVSATPSAEILTTSAVESIGNETLIPDGIFIDKVRFTVSVPGPLERGAETGIQFWVHSGEHSETKLKYAGELFQPEPAGKLPSERLFRRGPRLSVRLRLDGGLTCPTNHNWFTWNGTIAYSNFAIRVPLEAPDGDLICVASIRLDGCQIAKLTFLLNIGSKFVARQTVPCQTVMHRKAFASYDAADREEVLTRVKDMESVYRGLKVYVDAPTLRSITYWEGDLHARIDTAEIFYLFWSHHARASDWVEREWRWALRSKGLEFIDPVPIENLEIAPPPAELSAKSFLDPLLAFNAVNAMDVSQT